jgi:hypothetical protein
VSVYQSITGRGQVVPASVTGKGDYTIPRVGGTNEESTDEYYRSK